MWISSVKQRIAIILPPREGFSEQAFGAISLSIRDFTRHSEFADQTTILGMRTEPPFDGTHYEPLPVRRHWWETLMRAYERAIVARLATLKPALVEIHNRPVLVRRLANKIQAPIALHLHNDPQEMKACKTPAARARLLKDCTAIYCISEWIRDRFMEGLGSGLEKMQLIYSGIPIAPPAPPKKPMILYVGRMTPNKGALEFAQALAQVLPLHPDWRGTMIGGRRHSVSTAYSPYEQAIMHTMTSIGANAYFAGFCPFEQTQAAFREAAIVVIPSLWEEPFGRTGIEAMAQGCAVITSGRGGLREIFTQGGGVLLSEVNADTIAAAIHALIAHPAELARLQQSAYQDVTRFDIRTCTRHLDAVRRHLMTTPTQGHQYAA